MITATSISLVRSGTRLLPLAAVGAFPTVPFSIRGFAKGSAMAAAAGKKKKSKGKGGKDDPSGHRKDLDRVLAAIEAPFLTEPNLTEEEKKRRFEIGRNYVIGSFRQHNEIQHNLACKIQLKQHAIKMLHRHSALKEEALKIKTDKPPPWRLIPVWTVPIPGFNAKKFTIIDF